MIYSCLNFVILFYFCNFTHLTKQKIMANIKTGFSYYPVDTDRYQDIRIKRLKKSFGCDGVAVYDYLLCEIYRDKGCFLVWDESRAFDVAEYFGLKETLVDEIVNYCGVVGLFDKALLSGGNIITSASIQRRFVDMCFKAKRKDAIIPEYCTIIPEQSDIITETSNKVKKVKKIKKLATEHDEAAAALFSQIFQKWNSTSNLERIGSFDDYEDPASEILSKYSVSDIFSVIDYADKKPSLNGSTGTFKCRLSWLFKNFDNLIAEMNTPVPRNDDEQRRRQAKAKREALEKAEKEQADAISSLKARIYSEMKIRHGDKFNFEEYEIECKQQIKALLQKLNS